MPAHSLGKFLDGDAGLARFSAHAGRLLKLQHVYERAVPVALARCGRVANLKQGKIVIHASNGGVAAKIRQLAPRLTDVFNQAGAQVSEIQVKVQPSGYAPVASGIRSVAHMNESAQQGLRRLADGLPERSPLKAALLRFAERARIRGR
ncbi:MAG: DUF721 domain-containing protein [Rhodocyclaceae bacterium]|nr:DUF721 domain-containing protein [Rhodocyclaceae bacterium]